MVSLPLTMIVQYCVYYIYYTCLPPVCLVVFSWCSTNDVPHLLSPRKVPSPKGPFCWFDSWRGHFQKVLQPMINNYFTSSFPHHDIYTFCYWQIFWHSIWHIFWHFIWHIFWHSIWHIFRHIFRHIFWHSTWHSIWQIYMTFYLAFYLTYLLALYLAYLLAFYLAYLLAYLLAFYLAVEVQRCALSWEGPRLRSSGAHWARKVPGWGPAVRTELGRSQVEVQQCALSSEVGEELGEELARRKWRWKLMQTWSRRN